MSVVLYAHFRADDGLLFYIGIGSADRPWSTKNRSDWWGIVVDKHGYVVHVLQEGLTRPEAQELERVMIAEWRAAPDWLARLVNIMDGETGDYGHQVQAVGGFRERSITTVIRYRL